MVVVEVAVASLHLKSDLLECLQSLLLLPCVEEADCLLGLSEGEVRIDLQRLIEVIHSLLETSITPIDLSQIVMRLGTVGPEFNRK